MQAEIKADGGASYCQWGQFFFGVMNMPQTIGLYTLGEFCDIRVYGTVKGKN